MKTNAYISIFVSFMIVVALAYLWPEFINKNKFLSDFINHEILNLFGLIIAITFASVENILLNVTKIEIDIKSKLNPVKKELRENVIGMVVVFVFSFILIFFRDHIENEKLTAFVNGVHFVFILIYGFVLIDIFLLMSDMFDYMRDFKLQKGSKIEDKDEVRQGEKQAD